MEWFDFACPLRLEGRRGVLFRLSSAQTMKVVESCLSDVNHLALCLCISDLRTCGQSQGADPFFAPLCFALVGATGIPQNGPKPPIAKITIRCILQLWLSWNHHGAHRIHFTVMPSLYSTDVSMVWCRKGVISNCLYMLLLSDIFLFLTPVTFRIRSSSSASSLTKETSPACAEDFTEDLAEDLAEDLSFLPLPPPLAPFFLGCALGLALEEGVAEVKLCRTSFTLSRLLGLAARLALTGRK